MLSETKSRERSNSGLDIRSWKPEACGLHLIGMGHKGIMNYEL